MELVHIVDGKMDHNTGLSRHLTSAMQAAKQYHQSPASIP